MQSSMMTVGAGSGVGYGSRWNCGRCKRVLVLGRMRAERYSSAWALMRIIFMGMDGSRVRERSGDDKGSEWRLLRSS